MKFKLNVDISNRKGPAKKKKKKKDDHCAACKRGDRRKTRSLEQTLLLCPCHVLEARKSTHCVTQVRTLFYSRHNDSSVKKNTLLTICLSYDNYHPFMNFY